MSQIIMTNRSPKISVIVCILGIDQVVINCLESIAQQTYKNYELIVVYKASEDSRVSDVICEIFGRAKCKKVIGQKEGKLSDARNLGISEASGDFLTFIDGDDLVKPDHFKGLLSPVKKDIDAVFSMPELQGEFSDQERKYFDNTDPGSFLANEQFILNTPVVVWGKLFRKSLIDKYGIRFPTNVIFEDNYFHWAYLSVANKVYITRGKTYVHFARSCSLMGKMKVKYSTEGLDNITVLVEIVNFLQKNGRDDIVSYKLIRRYFLDAVNFTDKKHFEKLYNMFLEVLQRLPTRTNNQVILKLARLGYPKKTSNLRIFRMLVKGIFSRLSFMGEQK